MLPDWFKLNCPSCSYRIHPEWVHGHAGTHTHAHMHKRANATVIRSGCRSRQWQQFYLLNVWKCNYFPPSGHVCVREAEPENLFAVLTVRWVSAGRWKRLQQRRRSGSCSDRWGKEKRRVGYITWAHAMWTSQICLTNDHERIHQQRSRRGDRRGRKRVRRAESVNERVTARNWMEVSCSLPLL